METQITELTNSTLITRGKRSIYVIGSTDEQRAKAVEVAGKYSFNKLFNSATSGPISNSRVLKFAA